MNKKQSIYKERLFFVKSTRVSVFFEKNSRQLPHVFPLRLRLQVAPLQIPESSGRAVADPVQARDADLPQTADADPVAEIRAQSLARRGQRIEYRAVLAPGLGCAQALGASARAANVDPNVSAVLHRAMQAVPASETDRAHSACRKSVQDREIAPTVVVRIIQTHALLVRHSRQSGRG